MVLNDYYDDLDDDDDDDDDEVDEDVGLIWRLKDGECRLQFAAPCFL